MCRYMNRLIDNQSVIGLGWYLITAIDTWQCWTLEHRLYQQAD